MPRHPARAGAQRSNREADAVRRQRRAARRATRFEALEPLRQAVRHSFGAFGKGLGQGTRLRHDHGSQFVSDDFQAEVAFLGLESSPAFVREPRLQGLLALSPAEIG